MERRAASGSTLHLQSALCSLLPTHNEAGIRVMLKVKLLLHFRHAYFRLHLYRTYNPKVGYILYGPLPGTGDSLELVDTHDERAAPSSETPQVLQVTHHLLQRDSRRDVSLLSRAG